MSEAADCAGQDVYIVGGANSAGQAAVYFSRQAGSVTHSGARSLVGSVDVVLSDPADRSDPKHQGAHQHRDRLPRTAANISKESTLRNNVTGDEEKVDTGLLFCFIGAAPRTDWLDGFASGTAPASWWPVRIWWSTAARPPGWPLDRDPYHLETSIPGVFVAGDVRAESVKRVASAVGEGAMAVTLVHRYLEKR